MCSQSGTYKTVKAMYKTVKGHIRQSGHMTDSQGTYKTVKAHIRQSRLRGCTERARGWMPGKAAPAIKVANMAHIRQSRPDSGLGSRADVLETF